MSSEADGMWLAIISVWICFGSYAVPMKSPAVLDAQVHPLVYQSYKTFWNLVLSHVIQAYEPYEFTWWGLVSGCTWIPAGIAAIIAVQRIGVAYAQALWVSIAMGTSCIWGFAVLKDETVYSWQVTAFAFILLFCGIVGMTFSVEASNKLSIGKASTITQPMFIEQKQAQTEVSVVTGIIAAICAGLFGGSALVPSTLAPLHGIHFVRSFALGSAIVNFIIIVIYFAVLRFWSAAAPTWHFDVMALPGFLSGSLWCIGNYYSLSCVDKLGQGIGFSIIVASVIVAGLWGILFYREVSGWPLVQWFLFCALCLVGVGLLVYEKKATTQ